MFFRLVVAAIVLSSWSRAEDFPAFDPEPIPSLEGVPATTAPEAPKETTPPQRPLFSGDMVQTGKSLEVSIRLDPQMSLFGAVTQGFSLPSMRVSALGQVSKAISYRVSLGQAREFTTALLPNIVPTEAFVDLDAFALFEGVRNPVRVRMGMFTPQLTPWWTPDLTDVRMPDYNEVDRAMLLGRDLGVEALFEPWDFAQFALGLFNGNGIYGQNTNSGKAMTGYGRLHVLQTSVKASVGGSLFWRSQSDAGSVNYKKYLMATIFGSLEIPSADLETTLEYIFGHQENSQYVASPFGWAATFNIGLTPSIRLFGRFEEAEALIGSNSLIRHYEGGPIFRVGGSLQIFTIAGAVQHNGSTPDVTFNVRLRLDV